MVPHHRHDLCSGCVGSVHVEGSVAFGVRSDAKRVGARTPGELELAEIWSIKPDGSGLREVTRGYPAGGENYPLGWVRGKIRQEPSPKLWARARTLYVPYPVGDLSADGQRVYFLAFKGGMYRSDNGGTSFQGPLGLKDVGASEIRVSPDGRQAILYQAWESAENGAWEHKNKQFRFTAEHWLMDLILFDVESQKATNLTAVDYVTHFELVYHIQSLAKNHLAVLKVRVEDRDLPEVPSVTPVWYGAHLQERERTAFETCRNHVGRLNLPMQLNCLPVEFSL